MRTETPSGFVKRHLGAYSVTKVIWQATVSGRPWIHCCIRTTLYAERGLELTAAAPWDYSDENDGHQDGSTWNIEYIEEQP